MTEKETDRIIVKNLWKKFKIGTKEKQTSLGKIKTIISGKEQRREFWALKDVSFTAKAGEVIGIVGDNGSGKSTLLRILAGIYGKDKGKILMNGKTILIGNDIGLNLSLNTVENIFLGCSILGLGNSKIKKRLREIISFAELQDFAYSKLYHYSTGMISRLSFSIAYHSMIDNSQILLIDETFSAGDKNFRKKSCEKIKMLKKEGATIFVVSHDLSILKDICDRIIWIENGEIRKEGDIRIIGEYYYSKNRD